jgi:uncharacterized protein YkwD
MSRAKSLSASLILMTALAIGVVPLAPLAHASGHKAEARGSHAVRSVVSRPGRGMPAMAQPRPGVTLQMFRATNASRSNNGVRRLQLDWKRSRVARHHAMAMARAHRLVHTTRIGRYLDGVGRWSAWGENIGWTTGSLSLLQRAFMASPEHRANILSRAFHHVAVGVITFHHQLWVSLFFYG